MRMLRLAAAIAAAFCVLPAAASGAVAACGSDVFFKADRISVDFPPASVATGDFNDDEIADLAVGSGGFPLGGLVAFLGDGDGTFGPPIQVADETVDFQFLIAADFNDDGATDLAVDVGNHFTGIYLSNGNGTFQDVVLYPGSQFPEGMAAANLTGEAVDIILTGDDGEAVVLPGNGDGTFGDPIHSGTAGSWLALGDVTGDGELDIVSVFDRYVGVSSGNGDRTFNPALYYAVAPLMTSVAITDMNGDAHDDVAVAIDDFAEVTGGYVAVLLNNGDGTLQAGVETTVGKDTRSLQVADLDGDGRQDAVVAANGFVNVLMGTGSASFDGPATYLAAGARALTLADFDGDGLLDVAAANTNDESVSILLSLGGGQLGASHALVIPFVNGPHDFAIADLDGDALGDLLATGDGLELRRGLGNGLFDANFERLGDITFAGAVAVADFDGDGLPDIAEEHASGGLLAIFLNSGAGEFEEAGEYFVPFGGFGDLLAADFDGNGSIDLAAAGGGPSFAVLLGEGDGTFGATVSTPLTNAFPIASVEGRFDNDGLPDVAFVASGGAVVPDSLRILLSEGDGSFSEHAEYPLASTPYGLAVADIAGGPALDIVVAGGGSGLILYVGNGDGTFQDPAPIPVDFFPSGVWIGDFDGDGTPDLAVPDSGVQFSPAVAYLRGLGGGDFEPPVSYPVSGQPIQGQAAVYGGSAEGLALLGTSRALSFLTPQRLTALALDASPVVGTPAHLHASASGTGPFSWQWRKNGVDLSDGGTVSGAHTPVLTIDPVTFDDAGAYDVLVTDACGTVASNVATLSVEFADVPVSSIFHDDIIAIATAGITAGCGGGDYCPTSPVRRDQMAAFLLRAEHGSDYTPPPCTGVFTDVPCPSLFADWIEQLAAEGVTAGCGTNVYCPSQAVTRAQMAVFLLKTSEGSGYTPPPATGIFGDVPVGSFAANFIEDLYNRNITGGCSAAPLLYCPASSVLRQQMATFLVRTFF